MVWFTGLFELFMFHILYFPSITIYEILAHKIYSCVNLYVYLYICIGFFSDLAGENVDQSPQGS